MVYLKSEPDLLWSLLMLSWRKECKVKSETPNPTSSCFADRNECENTLVKVEKLQDSGNTSKFNALNSEICNNQGKYSKPLAYVTGRKRVNCDSSREAQAAKRQRSVFPDRVVHADGVGNRQLNKPNHVQRLKKKYRVRFEERRSRDGSQTSRSENGIGALLTKYMMRILLNPKPHQNPQHIIELLESDAKIRNMFATEISNALSKY